MKPTEAITYISIATIVVSLFFIGTELTGFATTNDTGVVNVTVGSTAIITFTTDFLNFGTGAVNSTLGTIMDSEGTVVNGTWPQVTGELVLQNDGNMNVSLGLQTDKSAADFIGGTSGQTFEAKVTEDETGACITPGVFTSYYAINTTNQLACETFNWDDDADQVRIDFNMTIPSNAENGEKTIEIKAVGSYN